MDLANFDTESHAMRVTSIIRHFILQATHNLLNILYHVVHIIRSYAMGLSTHGHDIRTFQNEG